MTRDEVIELISAVTDEEIEALALLVAATTPPERRSFVMQTIDAGSQSMEARKRKFGAHLLRRAGAVLRAMAETPPSKP